MVDDRSLGEIGRSLDAVVVRLERIDARIEGLSTTYVPRELYDRDLREIRSDVVDLQQDLADDVASRKADRRLIIGAVLAVVSTIVVDIIKTLPGGGVG